VAGRKRSIRALTVKVKTSRRAAEAFRLEVRRLAARLGIPAAAVTIRRIDEAGR
jgi:hypothetical protein